MTRIFQLKIDFDISVAIETDKFFKTWPNISARIVEEALKLKACEKFWNLQDIVKFFSTFVEF